MSVLSSELIKQFVDATNDEKTSENKKIYYGSAVVNDSGIFVQIDGSEQMTPVSMATDAKNGDRVMVTIEDHKAVISANITSPSSGRTATDLYSTYVTEDGTVVVQGELRAAKEYVDTLIAGDVTADKIKANIAEVGELTADNVTIKESLTAAKADIGDLKADNVTIKGRLDANEADIGTLNADNVTIKGRLDANEADIGTLTADNVTIKESLTTAKADIGDLKAGNATIKGRLDANEADIGKLNTEKLSAKDADLKYANIDFTNVGKAAMEYFYANSGLIKDVVIGDATITGHLVGVTISGDLIEGETIVAEKLVIKGTDGLFYKLNTDGITTTAEQTEYNSLNGRVITAQSITAEKIRVDDLVAFDATIGGFKLTENSIHSGVKESVDNTTRGIYMDNDGQIALGDGSNYLKYYRDTNGKYKLDISAESIHFGVSGESVSDAIKDVQNNLNNEVEALKDEISTLLQIDSSRGTVFKNDMVSTILSVVIYRGSKRITDIDTLHSVMGTGAYLQWKWQRLNEDSFGVISSEDSRIGNGGFTFTLNPEDVDTKVVFVCELIL